MRKIIGFCWLAATVALSMVGGAAASSNYPDGTTVSGTNSGNITLSGLVTCGTSGLNGYLTNNGAGLGGDMTITATLFNLCSTTVASCKLPWLVHVLGGGPTAWNESFAICLDVRFSWGYCRYEGTLSGVTYDESTDLLTLGGTPTSTSGGICPPSGSMTGSYSITPADLDLS